MSNAFPSPMLMILLSEPFSIAAEALQEYLREKLNPELTVTGDNKNRESFVITWNNMAFAVMCVDQPIPSATFNTALKTSPGLIDGEKIIATHKAHIIISPLTSSDKQLKSIFLALGVMTIADLIAIQAGPEGFYWGNSEVLVENSRFASYTGQAGEALGKFNQKVPNALYGLPSTLWAGLRFFSPDQKTQFGAITKGLDALTGFEIQIEPYVSTQAEVAKHLLGMVAYTLANGAVFQEGNTIGIEQDKNFRMRLIPEKSGMPARWAMSLDR
ncbi:DUF4261 domain-containing protein [Ketobacter sp.]|uniref:DUF4261 domain-containing protein n=1 Tax=Ketobacter sp. TaxID=2083498 RepID=UPI000F144F34|nr:DUF4261 domain-containing protein [Ketobacter sp.]RLU00338.1 MAG: DUF4261 domain-containing protein [Ketobacter sp.]